MQRLADLRSTVTDLDSASDLFNRLAKSVLTLEAKNASFERRIADLKTTHEHITAELKASIQDDAAELTAFIDANRHLFASPRKVQTSLGAFGLQKVSDLVVLDQEALLTALFERGYDDCFKTTRSAIKPAIRKRIAAGESLPGAAIREGDTAVYTVDRALINQAREEHQA